MRHAGLVTSRKEAQRVFYRLTGEDVLGLVISLRGVAERHLAELDAHLTEFDTEHEIVAYCRGPCCVLACLLRGKGFKVQRLQDGYPEWKGAGLPVERSVV